MANIKENKAILEAAGIDFPADAKAADLQKIVDENLNSDNDGDDTPDSDDSSDDSQDSTEDNDVAEDQGVVEKGGVAAMRKKIEGNKKDWISLRLSYRRGDIPVEDVIINGVKFQVPRGKTVKIPEAVAALLENKIAAEEGLTENTEGAGVEAATGVKLDGSVEELK